MKAIEIKAFKRQDVGKKATKALRKQGNVPAVLYGGDEIVHFYAATNEFNKLIYTTNVYIIDVNVEGTIYKAIIQDLQFHPVSDEVIHVDLLQAFEDKPIVIEIPVKLNGLAKGVKAGGKLNLELRKLRVRGLIKDIPNELNIDISNLGLGKSVQVGSLEFPNIELLHPEYAVVTSVRVARGARDEDEEEEEGAAEGEEGAEAPAEGAETEQNEEQK